MIDPAAGSYYIETWLYLSLNRHGNSSFAVEEEGGFYAALKAGTVQAAVKRKQQSSS